MLRSSLEVLNVFTSLKTRKSPLQPRVVRTSPTKIVSGSVHSVSHMKILFSHDFTFVGEQRAMNVSLSSADDDETSVCRVG